MKNTALITGASSGIGRELARIHAENGGDLVIVARRQAALETLKQELEAAHNIKVLVLPKDLTNPAASQQIYDELQSAQIEVKYLMNNAGFGGVGKFHEREWKQDKAMIQLNITALTELCRLFLPDFVARNEGRILNVSSTASFAPGPLQAVYYASKAYVRSFTNAITQEVADTNVTVTNLMPGATATEFGKTSGMDKTSLFHHTVSARSVAQAGYTAMMKGQLDIISGLSWSQRITIALIPFIPKKMLLQQIYKLQQTED